MNWRKRRKDLIKSYMSKDQHLKDRKAPEKRGKSRYILRIVALGPLAYLPRWRMMVAPASPKVLLIIPVEDQAEILKSMPKLLMGKEVRTNTRTLEGPGEDES